MRPHIMNTCSCVLARSCLTLTATLVRLQHPRLLLAYHDVKNTYLILDFNFPELDHSSALCTYISAIDDPK
jgi:hypothetical protein